MSKDKPEVGDVWEYMDGSNVLVVNVYSDSIDCLYFWQDKLMYIDNFNKKDFVRLAKYLGKSKVRIEDLFKTENE